MCWNEDRGKSCSSSISVSKRSKSSKRRSRRRSRRRNKRTAQEEEEGRRKKYPGGLLQLSWPWWSGRDGALALGESLTGHWGGGETEDGAGRERWEEVVFWNSLHREPFEFGANWNWTPSNA
ncbi:uncharacterized protein [Physcomitrium patens]|uniref:uncharacterized protein n=1 Tax=Physcomitrium patens TaxID=3218 RepID=UPI000D15B0E1|nr:uncharacterized protein LOC112287130 [Physcomitrium patens]|eukprot:XP_024385619.1 uncharacterized protein LOC112287130 [Physcomitrella patens]